MPTTAGGAARPRQRWVTWTIPALLFLVGFFHRAAPGVMARDLMQSFDVTSASIGSLAATYFYAYAALMIPAGLLLDAFGVRIVVAIGGAIMGAGALMMGVAGGATALFAGRFLVGLGAAATFIGTLKIAAAWFPPTRFGFLAALTATVGMLGALLSTLPLAAVVATIGWRRALTGVGIVTLALAVLCVVVVRDRPSGVAAPSALTLRAVLTGTLDVLRNPHTWPPFLAFFCLYSAAGNLMLWIVPYLRDVYALGARPAAFYAMATSLALLVAGPLTGWISDRVLGRRKALYAVLSSLQVVLWTAFVLTLGALPLAGLYALLFAMGLAGASFVLVWPIGREVNPPHLDGVAVAVVNFGGFLGAALTQGPLGAVLDAQWAGALADGVRRYPVEAYRTGFAVCAAFVVAAAFLSLLMHETRGHNIHAALRRRRLGPGIGAEPA
jgi:nitrate/nitrite transporter NarK